MDYTNTDRQSYARFASQEEIKDSLYRIIFDETKPEFGGIPLYAENGAVYVEDKDAHTMVVGSTGAKKAVY